MALRLIVLSLVAILLGLYLGPYRDRAKAENDALAEIASWIAGRPVSIHCPSTLERLTEVSPHDGSVAFSADGRPADYADLSGATCAYLKDFDDRTASDELDCLVRSVRCPRDVEQTAVAVNVLTHESYHLAGHRSESAVQCFAMQRNAEAARLLGASPEQADGIARFVYERVYPALPQEYRSSDCHDGGPYDLRPASSDWPS
jgi:hypothetical protein